MNRIVTSFASMIALGSMLYAAGPVSGGQLEKDFESPPNAVRASGYWFWLNNRVDEAGITRDLEEFKAKGMGSVGVFSLSPDVFGGGKVPPGPDFMSPEFRKLVKHAVKEGARLGIDIGFNLCSGWCMGGPWITPENSGRWHLNSELKLTGPQKFSGKLPVPAHKAGWKVCSKIDLTTEQADIRDVAVVAFREQGNSRFTGDGRNQSFESKSNRRGGACFELAHDVMAPTLAPWGASPKDKPVNPADVVDLTSRC